MKVSYLAIAAVLATTATGAFAETGVKIGEVDNVANVYGRAGVPSVRIIGTVMTRPADEVPAGPDIVAGTTAVAAIAGGSGVNAVKGRS